jgi:hypothetical protein
MCGKGVYFRSDELAYQISEGFCLDKKMKGLGRAFVYLKSRQELHFYFDNHQGSIANGIFRENAVGIHSYTGYFKNHQWNGIARVNFPDGGSYFGGWKDGKRNGMGIYTYPDGRRDKGLFDDTEFIVSVDFNEALLN